jgi:HK97 family phage major capsid protein
MIKSTYGSNGEVLAKGYLEPAQDIFTTNLYNKLEKALSGNEELKSRAMSMYKALDTQTTLEGKNTVETLLFRGVLERVRLFGTVAPLFRDIIIPENIYELPVELEDAKVFLTAESTEDNSSITASASTPTIDRATIQAFKLSGKSLVSTELEEDSVIDIIKFIVDSHARAIARGFDQSIVDGDIAGSHQDSDVTSARDPRKAVNGLRKLALAQAATIVDGSTFTLNTITDALAKMGKFGGPNQIQNVAMITGLSVYNRLLALALNTANNNQVAFDLQGGVLRSINGIQIVVSEDIRQDLNNNGVYDGSTTTKTYALLVNTSQFITGTRSVARFESDKNYNTDQVELYSRIRKGFTPIFTTSATNTNVVVIRNITS